MYMSYSLAGSLRAVSQPLQIYKTTPITGRNGPLGPQYVADPRISRQSAHEDGKVRFTHRSPLPQGGIHLVKV